MNSKTLHRLELLDSLLEGEVFTDDLMRKIYATDASVYQQLPMAVIYPKGYEDIQQIVHFASDHGVSIIPRAAGTSLAGQTVGNGIVVDISKYLNKIIELNLEEQWVLVEPGVIRDELNAYLKPFGYFFSPTTATANRAMIGGMVGNNSCGQTSIEYGSTRDHVLEIRCILSDGSEARFHQVTKDAFEKKCTMDTLEGQIYRFFKEALDSPSIQKEICAQYPKASIQRRNTGYAIDLLAQTEVFRDLGPRFDLCKLLAGSEGTLGFTTQVRLHIDPLPKKYGVVVASHFDSIQESLKATQLAMTLAPSACELMDKTILDCTKENIDQRKNRFFIKDDPQAVLLTEFRGNTEEEAKLAAGKLLDLLQVHDVGYAHPVIDAKDTHRVWNLRKAGLGSLANLPGDRKAVACIEDTAVALEDLPKYIEDFTKIMTKYKQKAVYYAHVGDGEVHLRPILDLKQKIDRILFYDITKDVVELVKKYRGSLSGEHGDGRVRGYFLKEMIGPELYHLCQAVKKTWDPNNLFNPGKIVDVPKMNEDLRFEENQQTPIHDTIIDFGSVGGLLRAAEKCNGSGDCRKLPLSGGTMCPSYHATRNEMDTTRARANTLRHILSQDNSNNAFDSQELKEVLDLCLACKGCASECPSNVDMASMKAEFLHQYHQHHRTPLRAQLFARVAQLNKLGTAWPGLTNQFLGNGLFAGFTKKALGIARQRHLPRLVKNTLWQWYQKNQSSYRCKSPIKTVYLFCDEFTNYQEAHIGIKSIKLLHALNYQVEIISDEESGRAAISKGLLEYARQKANHQIHVYKDKVSEDNPLLGIEPSAILSFQDEYPRLVDPELRDQAKGIAKYTYLIDEFISQEFSKGNIDNKLFTQEKKSILFHGHCHQKALADVSHSLWSMSIPSGYEVSLIQSGCCGMAGSFGYEKEHFDISMRIGSIALFPAIEQAGDHVLISATGTSCRHQVKDALNKSALHPMEILYDALVADP